jgi:FkbM family methyltransferase
MNLSVLHLQTRGGQAPFYFRNDSVGDNGVIQQIFQNRDYDFSMWQQGKRLLEHHREQSKSGRSLIIDAGANIGASVVYFLETFDSSIVYAIEPDKANFEILEMNTRRLTNKINFHGAVSSADGELALEDPGQSDWGFRTRPIIDGKTLSQKVVRSISPATILGDPRLADAIPLIFKIDIEGAESDLFSGDTSWIGRFPLLIIELHDWLLPFSGSSRNFFGAIVKHDFDFLYRGENIFLFSRPILARGSAV